MVHRNFVQNYQDLEQISDKSADIYGSELCRDILRLEPCSLDLLKMQLEQERFFRQIGEHSLHGLSDQDKLSRTFQEAVGAYLEEWLAHYDSEDRRGILLELLIALEGRGHWSEERLAAAARLPAEQLTDLAAREVERYAIKLCAERVEPDSREAGIRAYISDRPVPTAAALSISAYAEYPELRVSPELIALAASAAANTAHTESRETAEETAGVGAYMELMIATASLVERPELPAFAVSESKKPGETNAAQDLFQAFLALFFTDLTFLLGAAAVGIIVGSAAILAKLADASAPDEAGECTIQNEQALCVTESEEEEEQVQEEESDDELEFG